MGKDGPGAGCDLWEVSGDGRTGAEGPVGGLIITGGGGGGSCEVVLEEVEGAGRVVVQ